MKKNFFLLFLTGLLLFLCSSVFANSAEFYVGDEQHDILICPKTDSSSGAPRSPAYNPFFAYEDGTCVTLGSMSPYGVVSVTLVSTAGDYYQTFFDTEDLQIVIPISGSTGHYTLTLVTERGLVFEGEFEI